MKKCLWLPEKSEQYINQYSHINNLSGDETSIEVRDKLKTVNKFKESRNLNYFEKGIGFVGFLLNVIDFFFSLLNFY